MPLYAYALCFLFFWACIGSFCWVVMEKKIQRSFWTGRSQCLTCRKKLQWYELIPLFSYSIQAGKCRTCRTSIPAWVIGIELLVWLLWMVFGIIFVTHGYSLWSIWTQLVVLTLLWIIAFEDIRSLTIPDTLTLPTIFLVCIFVSVWTYSYANDLFPTPLASLLGGIVGMVFYLIQMMIPWCLFLMKKKHVSQLPLLLLLPLFFPCWLVTKMLFGEKRADKWIPSIARVDELPSWVWGGDVRLGLLVGLITGPVYFWWVVWIGYVAWTLFWGFSRWIGKKEISVLPVAPLLYVGILVTWCLLIYS